MTGHFSRYALGAPKWATLTDGFQTKKRWGKYDPETGIRKAGVGIKGDVSGDVRLLITDITADGVNLMNNTGTTTDGTRFIDVTLDEKGQFDAELLFSIQEKKVIDENEKEKYVPSSLNFDFSVEVRKKS